MPDQYTISSLTAISVSEPLGMNDLVEVARVDAQGETGYSSRKATIKQLAEEILNDIQYTSELDTTAKKIIGAINELNARSTYTDVTGTLTAGSTSITLQATEITTTSTIDIYTDTFGIQPVNAVVATGTITITFLAQASNISVKVRVS